MTGTLNGGLSTWTHSRALPWVGTNAGSAPLPFQRWHHFKEAFAPELVERVCASAPPGSRVLDPFGGSGTTALACQFLGVSSTTLEVNPFLSDVIRAKLARYDLQGVQEDLETILSPPQRSPAADIALPDGAPATLIAPGVKGRYVFDKETGLEIVRIRDAIGRLPNPVNARLLRVLMGGILIELSNVTVNGKGRRYRKNWERRAAPGVAGVESALRARVAAATADIAAYSERADCKWDVVTTDARAHKHHQPYGSVVCSPPYPNSFDYTDVYNLELWMLGYLGSKQSNLALRRSTLSSHVQIHREFGSAPEGSFHLTQVLEHLNEIREDLWNPRIPEMIAAYFAELLAIFTNIRPMLHTEGRLWLVVGDSQYRGELVPVALILGELLESTGWQVESSSESRSMRVSPQQGGQKGLEETLLILRPDQALPVGAPG